VAQKLNNWEEVIWICCSFSLYLVLPQNRTWY